MTEKSVIHVFSFRMTDNERDENTVNDVTDSDNDQELLVEASRDTSHATTNLETLMHLFKVCTGTIDIFYINVIPCNRQKFDYFAPDGQNRTLQKCF